MDIKKLDVSQVSICIRVMKLDLKYWGQVILIKIVSMLGKSVKTDYVIIMRELLYYFRIIVEVSIEDEFFETVSFQNEWSGIQYYLVKYE